MIESEFDSFLAVVENELVCHNLVQCFLKGMPVLLADGSFEECQIEENSALSKDVAENWMAFSNDYLTASSLSPNELLQR
jgi:hypothetical protein